MDNMTIRVVDDLVNLLVEKSVIKMEDLPIRAQDKLIARGVLRKKLNN